MISGTEVICPLLKQKVNSQLRFLGTSQTPFLEPELDVLCIGTETSSLSRKSCSVSRWPPRSLQWPLQDLQPRLLSSQNAAKQASPTPRLDLGFPCGQTVWASFSSVVGYLCPSCRLGCLGRAWRLSPRCLMGTKRGERIL